MTNRSEEKSIAIIGTGSMACIFAARLIKVSNVLIVGTWQTQIDAINKNGITVHDIDGTVNAVTAQAACYPHLPASFNADFIIVLVKSHQTPAVIERIKAVTQTNTVVLTLQNGLGNIELIKSALPNHFVSAGVTTQGGNIIGPAVVEHNGDGVTFLDDSEQLHDLYKLFVSAKIPTQTPSDANIGSINEALWRKLAINTAINPLTALLGECNGFLADNEVARSLSQATTLETLEIAVAEGALPKDTTTNLKELATDVAKLSAKNRSSMFQDISRGSRTEIESMCGEVVRRAKKHGRSAPLNHLWLELIKKAEKNTKGSSGKSLYTIDDLTSLVSRNS